MATTQDDMIVELEHTIAELRHAALAREATLAQELAARDATLTQRNTDYSERIEHQAAIVDVLRVMSASPGDTQPVFDLIVRRAVELCNAQSGGLFQYDGERVHIGTIHGLYEHDGKLLHVQSLHGTEASIAPASLATYLRQFPMQPKRGSISMRAILDCQIMHIRDMREEVDLLEDVQRLGHRSQVSIPLLRDARAIGVITMAAHEPGGFSDSQIQLLKTFAEQAVISISSAETYRALQTRTSDLQESLEYQTATSEVLKVISRSTFDLQPVLDTVAKTSARLCLADQAAIFRRNGDLFDLAANFGFSPEYEAMFIERGPFAPDIARPTVVNRAAIERRVVHIDDVVAVPGYPDGAIRLGRQRTSLGVPLLREAEPVGVILLARQRVEPFTDRQIDLVSTFADQAVIAIENTRLLTEQREALEQQTATAEVLQLINASPGNLAPVFDAMLDRAMRLCDGAQGTLWMFDGERMCASATAGYSSELAEQLSEWREMHPFQRRLSQGDRVFQIVDLATEELYHSGNPLTRAAVDVAGIRTVVFVALVKDATALGGFTIGRREVRAFTDKHIALLQNFAEQAVIAIENARLINEQREALEQQTATAEVLQVINASPGNLSPVFDAILEKAHDLCGAAKGALVTFDGQYFQAVAARGLSETYAQMLREPRTTLPGSLLERLLNGASFVLEDTSSSPLPLLRAVTELEGVRTVLLIPLRRDSTLLGYITAYRQEVRPFTEKQIALLQNFAAQAVIAMENARLITEQREALEQQTAIADVLRAINATPGELAPVFDVIGEKAIKLCDATAGALMLPDGDRFRAVALGGVPEAYAEFCRNSPAYGRPNPGSLPARMLAGDDVVHIKDITDVDEYAPANTPSARALAELGGGRTLLGVALRKDDKFFGMITIFRQAVRPFSDRQVVLLQSFADQAVIAMENARLLEEVRQRQEELRITFENMGDGVAMFDETQHLVAWNRKFQDILDVPDDIIARRQTFTEYVHYLAERGEYDPEADLKEHVRGLIEQAGQSRTYERTRPDGRVIEIRHNPVPSGGFVLIYADITDRKRNEAEIRAARDAAEEASRTIEAAYRELKTAQANLIQAEKMASLGQLTAGIAHEIKNPLNFVNNFAALSVDLLSELKETASPGFAALTDDQRAEIEDISAMLTSNLEKITEHGKRADGIVKAMLEHSRGSSGERRMVNLNALIDEALNLAYHGARAQDQSFNITLKRDFGEGIAPIEVNPQDMTRVFLNIFGNGFYATNKRARSGEDSAFMPTLKVTTHDAGEAVEIRVRDNGTGIPADITDKLFQPFFTTKPTGEGTGLGLSITYDIVTKAHGGSISVDSEVGEYSEFTVRLPRNP